MAQYKVPQDVEADDKLLGPFSFRQFVYLLIAGGLIAATVGLFQLFPLLAIIPIPFILFFLVLALPLKKDQPMETYLAAIVSYYLKPHTRLWTPGQKESTIEITAPKNVEKSRIKDITGEEATHRLSFLADIVDTEGYAIKGMSNSSVREDFMAEANTAVDMFEGQHFNKLDDTLQKDENERRAEIMGEMQEAINNKARESEEKNERKPRETEANAGFVRDKKDLVEEIPVSPSVILPDSSVGEKPVEKLSNMLQKTDANASKSSIIELANNDTFSVATIAEQAKRINGKEEGEVFISLH